MIGAHIAHDCIVGNNVVIANSAAIAGHAKISDDVIIGGNCGTTIHKNRQNGDDRRYVWCFKGCNTIWIIFW